MNEYIVRMPSDMPYEIKAELNAWYVNSEPIVRCRDCENARVQPWNAITRTGLWCIEHDIPINVEGFCAWGERKSEGE